jgi:hypothetical protein
LSHENGCARARNIKIKNRALSYFIRRSTCSDAYYYFDRTIRAPDNWQGLAVVQPTDRGTPRVAAANEAPQTVYSKILSAAKALISGPNANDATERGAFSNTKRAVHSASQKVSLQIVCNVRVCVAN